ncbi:NAD(P)-dependent oxidoreductase [Microbacterium halophytorum]|uniref:NAD(P)-dependent oxidoreductase n=1 Tax=Microbacterium halophytorum TaxID=2067568 RepID=UPI000CFAF6F7|nr:NAD(P)-binding domain-containing protein [Microbacterium halophytorum]
MAKIAFIGLGIMGLPMAGNLARAGHGVTAVVRSEAAADRAERAGLAIARDARAAVGEADVAITMLPDTPDVEAVLEEILLALRRGATVIDMSTIDAEATRGFAARVASAGAAYLDAPVSGGEAGAIDGVLSIMVGGSDDDVAAALPLFEAMGRTIVHVGPVGSGQVVKAANQLIVAGNIQLVAEAIVLLESQGAQLPEALEVIGGGLAGSTVLERKGDAMLNHRFDPGFRLELHAKDLGIVEKAAMGSGLALPLTAAVTQLVRALVARGDGGLDHSALLKLTEELNGSR